MNREPDVLFDVLGPKGRRRARIATVGVVVVLAGLLWLALRQFAVNGQLDLAKWQPFTSPPILRFLLVGLGGTLQATAASALLAFPLGAALALLRLARSAPVRWPAAAYVELFRALPVLLLIYVFLLVLPQFGVRLPLFWQLVIPIVMSGSASAAEIFRAGVLSLERGQSEAGYSLGLGYWQTMRLIVLPQVLRQLLPVLITQLITLLKETTLGYVVSFPELLHNGQTLGEYTQTLIQAYLVVALVFVLTNAGLSQLAVVVDRRLGSRGRRALGSAGSASGAHPGGLQVRLDA